jgi:hypothetical protein
LGGLPVREHRKNAAICQTIDAVHLAKQQFIALPVQSKSVQLTFSSTGQGGLSIGGNINEHDQPHSPRRTDDFHRNHCLVAGNHALEL